jgi:sugar phosphate isomerase/epimerase
MIRIGCSVPVTSARLAGEIGFDFLELRVAELHPGGSQSEFLETARLVEAAAIPAETFAFLLPRDMKVVGPSVDLSAVRRWVSTAFERANSLGGRIIVVGSGDARRIPAGFSKERARSQFISFLVEAVELASKAGLTLALEPLNRTESNMINSLDDALALVRSLSLPNLGVVGDVYHMHLEDEPVWHLAEARADLRHVQLADVGRVPPGEGNLDFPTIFTYLSAIPYTGGLALECSFTRFRDQAPLSLDYVRRVSSTTGALTFAD